jgi:hypothetical protein
MRGSSGNPAHLEGCEQRLAPVTEARAWLVLRDGGLATQVVPMNTIASRGLRDTLVSPGRILLPPLVVGACAPVAQWRRVPVLASTRAACPVIFGVGKVLPIWALHQARLHVGEDPQELGQSVRLLLTKRPLGQRGPCARASHPGGAPLSHCSRSLTLVPRYHTRGVHLTGQLVDRLPGALPAQLSRPESPARVPAFAHHVCVLASPFLRAAVGWIPLHLTGWWLPPLRV